MCYRNNKHCGPQQLFQYILDFAAVATHQLAANSVVGAMEDPEAKKLVEDCDRL